MKRKDKSKEKVPPVSFAGGTCIGLSISRVFSEIWSDYSPLKKTGLFNFVHSQTIPLHGLKTGLGAPRTTRTGCPPCGVRPCSKRSRKPVLMSGVERDLLLGERQQARTWVPHLNMDSP